MVPSISVKLDEKRYERLLEMGRKIEVSVIVPVYNVEKYLTKCLESLVTQTLRELEIIVVNDGSPDGSQAIIDDFAARYPDRIIPLIKENGGLGDARNFGLQHARGTYIGFVDSDDWVDAKMFEVMYHTAIEEGNDITICDFTSIYDGWETGWLSTGYRGGRVPTCKEDYMLYCLDPATACNKLFHRKLFQIMKFPSIWYEDMATTPVLLSYANKIGYLGIALYYYRQRANSIIKAQHDSRTLQVIDAWELLLQNVNSAYLKYAEYAVYFSIVAFLPFKPEYADNFLSYLKKNSARFQKNLLVQEAIASGQVEDLFQKHLIPKKLHYFWFGGNTKNEIIQKCMASWIKYAPSYEIIEWNETNCDVEECDYVREAYANKKWAFVADYFRIKRIYEYGGIYVETDTEFTNYIDILRLNTAFFEFETKYAVCSGIFGAIPRHPIIKRWLETYYGTHFMQPNATLNTSYTIVKRLTEILKHNYHLEMNGQYQKLSGDIVVYPPNVLIIDVFDGKNIAQHHYDASWWDVKTGLCSYKNDVLRDYFSSVQYVTTYDNQVETLRAQLNAMEKSTCWKITKPIRIITDFFKRIIHKIGYIRKGNNGFHQKSNKITSSN